MTREWKPGDVGVTAGVTHPPCRFIVGEGGRARYVDGDNGIGVAESARPLVVIDPEDREQVERLAMALSDSYEDDFAPYEADHMQVALRSLIEPPKPEEPTGRYAVVVDREGVEWLRKDVEAMWCSQTAKTEGGLIDGHWRHYGDISAVRVLSEGVRDV